MELISVGEAARALGVSPRRVRALIGSNQLPAIRLGRGWALDRSVLRAPRRSVGGRPISAGNAWALLALLSGSEPFWVDAFCRSRLKRRLLSRRSMEKALSWCEPRSASYSLRFLPNDLPSLLDYGLVRTGLAARIPGVDVVHVADELDGYVRREALTEIKRRFRPLESSTNPNVVLRVPTHAWILHQASVGPPAVVAADLLVNPDGRVVRAGRRLLESIARHWNPRSRS